jgi:hypothetical protein
MPLACAGHYRFNPRPTLRPGDDQTPDQFQSTPDLAAGRCTPARASHSTDQRLFQSTPDLAAGRCRRRNGGNVTIPNVSIHARPCGRAMRQAYALGMMRGSATQAFQSTPDLAAGRCACCARRIIAIASFNPRPTLRPGDAGRGPYGVWASGRDRAALFQSTPDLAAGRCPIEPRARARDYDVSIHARPCGRAMRTIAHSEADERASSFNPRPTLRPGDARSSMCGSRSSRFNPRPTLRPGDAASASISRRQRVSIHARPCGRAMPHRVSASAATQLIQSVCFNPRPTLRPGDAIKRAPRLMSSLFQSTPDLAAGRCGMPNALVERSSIVSIHARPCGRAMRMPPASAPLIPVFQSTPDLAAGRCGTDTLRSGSASFNPRPTLRPGDADQADTQSVTRATRVSIHARPCGRAMPRAQRVSIDDLRGCRSLFQSTPDLAAGRCERQSRVSDQSNPRVRRSLLGVDRRLSVSIHARPCGRAMHLDRASRPPPRQFQSTPDLAAGRCIRRAGMGRGRTRCFNPRPTLRPGDATDHIYQGYCAIDVSIHARPCGRAMPRPEIGHSDSEQVSIHARPCGRAMRRCCCRCRAVLVFQSTPDLAAGRCAGPGSEVRRLVVSIHARPCGRAMRAGRDRLRG